METQEERAENEADHVPEVSLVSALRTFLIKGPDEGRHSQAPYVLDD